MHTRHYNFLDKVIIQLDQSLSILFANQTSVRANPTTTLAEPLLTEAEKRESASLMRVNHAGEICAQALYQGQLCVAHSSETTQMLKNAAVEEIDHLAWTSERISELGSHRSYLNVFWFLNSFLIGVMAGLAGDRWSLGFVEETEKQVTLHLEKHLRHLPQADYKSHAIVAQMRDDEACHGSAAAKAGAQELPQAIKLLMRLHALVMTSLSYKI